MKITFITRRRLLLAALLSPSALAITGCPNPNAGKDSPVPPNSGYTSAPSASPGASMSPGTGATSGATRKIKAGLVTDVGGVNDKSFNTLAWEGLQRAGKEFGAEIKYTESKQNADYVANLSQFARAKYDVVFAVGFLMQDAVKEVAAKYPDTKFAIIDGDAPDAPNAVSYKFKEEEGSFLAGAMAAGVSKSGTVGFVGGMEMPLIKKFEVGYTAGAKTINPKVNVTVGYAGKFDDPQRGQEIALSQMGAGADVVFHAAGATGTGVIKAVQGKGAGYYAIGVDKDQDGEAPGRVLTSMVKKVDVAVYDVCKAVASDSFKPGTIILGLKDGAVGLSEMKYTKKDIPAPVMAKVEALQKQITDGTLKPPSTPEELATFKAPATK